jgi:enediyne biosynthesis protein E4
VKTPSWGTRILAIVGGSCLAVAAVAWFLTGPPSRPDASGRPGEPDGAERAESPIVLRDATAQAGIAWRHTDGSSGKRYIVETITAGLATFDYDGDSLIDIYFVSGAPLQGTRVDVPPGNALYRNLGGFQFVDVTAQTGVGDLDHGVGVTVGDYDNDGAPDLYVSNFGPKVLYRNNGDGTFSDVTREAGVADGDRVGAGACFLDIEGDGDLDLFVANYVDFSYEKYKPHIVDGFHIYPSPVMYNRENDTLFRNNGDGTFTDVSQQAGIIDNEAGTGMGTVCADYDNDGDTDIFVLNDVAQNYFYENDGSGKFSEVGMQLGLGFDGQGRYLASMGVDCADYDNDGWLDFFQTSYSEQQPALYRNSGQGFFEDRTTLAMPGTSALPYINWGVNFADFDNDGDRDLFFANGNTQDNLEAYTSSATYEAPNTLLMNTGDGKFVELTDRCGDGLAPRASSRGSAVDDLDNDGDPDIVVLNARREPTIIRNDSPRAGKHWIQIEVRGVTTNRDGVGAHVRVTAGGKTQLQEVHSGRSYQGHCGSRLHFGLGPSDRIEALEVRRIGGAVERFEDIGADQRIVLIEGAPQPQGVGWR